MVECSVKWEVSYITILKHFCERFILMNDLGDILQVGPIQQFCKCISINFGSLYTLYVILPTETNHTGLMVQFEP